MLINNSFLQPTLQGKYPQLNRNSQIRSSQRTSKPINFGNLTKLSYAVIDGDLTSNPETLKVIISQFIKQLNKYNPKDNALRLQLREATKDYGSLIKRIGNYIVTGSDAVRLATIWSQSGVSSMAKKREASNFVKELFCNASQLKICVFGTSEKIKGKIKYNITDLFTTIY